MSTYIPVVHNGRAYIGVSGTAQFGAYSGHNITVIDLESMSIAYTVRTKGYPQTSGLLTTAYESEDGYAYIYFIDNYTPGQVRVIKDKPGVTEVVDGVKESYMNRGEQITVTCAPVLFAPSGAHAQYAICSPISDENGTLYFKNDSAYMMAVGSKVESIRVTCQPSKTLYTVGEPFDKSGMTVTAKFANGLTADVTDYVTFNKSSSSFSINDTDVTVYHQAQLYGDEFDAENGNKTNVEIVAPECYVPITVLTAEGKAALESVIAKIDAIGEVTLESKNAVDASKIPAGGYVKWTADNGNFSYNASADGSTCKITPKSSGTTTFTATVYDKDGNVVSSDTQQMKSKAGVWEKIIAFFKNLFGLTKTYHDAFKYIF